ncbi:MAG: hypothetical protein AAB871_01075 [Patescibacteria group bacterium]
METQNIKYYLYIFLGVFLLAILYYILAQGVSFQYNTAQFIWSTLILAITVGVLYNLWRTTLTFGGIIGKGLRMIGLGIVFLSVEALDRVAVAFTDSGIVSSLVSYNMTTVVHNSIFVVGLFFVAVGYIRLSSAGKN